MSMVLSWFFGDLYAVCWVSAVRDEQLLPRIKLLTAGKAGSSCFHLPVPLVYPIPRTARMLFLMKFAAEVSARKQQK